MGIINQTLSKCNLWISRIFPRPFELYAIKGKDLIGVEIGVFDGLHARSMLKTLDIRKLFLVDSYEKYDEGNKHYGIEQIDLKTAKEQAQKNTDWLVNVHWIFLKSEDEQTLKIIPDDLDFVYIDGAHDYESVKRDIENYWKKIKIGGVIGGHDFFNGYGANKEEHSGLVMAVIEFCVDNKLQLYVCEPDWWIVNNGYSPRDTILLEDVIQAVKLLKEEIKPIIENECKGKQANCYIIKKGCFEIINKIFGEKIADLKLWELKQKKREVEDDN